jgi:hypothetical protein
VDAGVSEMDEMALVGVLSTMLLRAQLVARAGSAAPVVPGRVVVGSTVESGDARAFSSARVHADA